MDLASIVLLLVLVVVVELNCRWTCLGELREIEGKRSVKVEDENDDEDDSIHFLGALLHPRSA